MALVSLEFNAEGMHCAACENYLETQIKKHKGVKKVEVKLSKGVVKVEIDSKESQEKLALDFTELVKENGYKIVIEKSKKNWKKDLRELAIAGVISLLFVTTYLFLEKNRLIPVASGGFELNYITSFALGIVASLSTCSAVLGGVILSLSSNTSKKSKKLAFFSGISFHVSRLLSFLILGAFLGLLGQVITSGSNFSRLDATFWVNLVLGGVMLILGLNLLDLLSFHYFNLKMPKLFGTKIAELSDSKTGILAGTGLGFLSFFLPCNFTQAIQFQGFASADPVNSALLLFAFAMGTLPVLALLTFASINFSKSLRSGIFYKTSGILVIILAIYTIYSSLYLKGII